MEEAKTVLNSLALGWQSEIQAFAPGGEDPKTSDKLPRLVHLLAVYTPTKVLHKNSISNAFNLQFLLRLLQEPTKNKTKNHTLDTSNVNSFQILFKYKQTLLGPEKQKLESLASTH